MVAVSAPLSSASPPAVPIRRIGPADLRIALRMGWDDFLVMRGDILFVALIYPLVGLVTAFLALDGLPLHLFFPLAAGGPERRPLGDSDIPGGGVPLHVTATWVPFSVATN